MRTRAGKFTCGSIQGGGARARGFVTKSPNYSYRPTVDVEISAFESCGTMFVPIPTNKNPKILYDTYFDPRNVINLIKMSENDVITTKIVPQNLAQFLQEQHMVLACRMYWVARHHFL